ncbi:MAG: CapA family protein [Eubacteriales bacterium]
MKVKEKIIVARLLYLLAAFCLTAALIGLAVILNTDASYAVPLDANDTAAVGTTDPPLEASPVPEEAYEVVRLTFAGSCTAGSMLGSDSYGTFNEMLTSSGPSYFLGNLEPMFAADDLTIAGCDVVLSDSDALESVERTVPEWYRGKASAAEIFSGSGVEVLSLECFHTRDYGNTGYADTKAALEAAGLSWGDHSRAVYYEKSGLSVAVYCRYLEDENDAAGIIAWLNGASASNDYVALYLTTPETGSYLPDESRRTLFRSFVDAGADLVVGTDTASIQPCEKYGEGAIFYSLGALLDGASKYPDEYTLLLGVELQVIDGTLQKAEYTITPCCTYDNTHAWRPSILTAEDADTYTSVMDFLRGARSTP